MRTREVYNPPVYIRTRYLQYTTCLHHNQGPSRIMRGGPGLAENHCKIARLNFQPSARLRRLLPGDISHSRLSRASRVASSATFPDTPTPSSPTALSRKLLIWWGVVTNEYRRLSILVIEFSVPPP